MHLCRVQRPTLEMDYNAQSPCGLELIVPVRADCDLTDHVSDTCPSPTMKLRTEKENNNL